MDFNSQVSNMFVSVTFHQCNDLQIAIAVENIWDEKIWAKVFFSSLKCSTCSIFIPEKIKMSLISSFLPLSLSFLSACLTDYFVLVLCAKINQHDPSCFVSLFAGEALWIN